MVESNEWIISKIISDTDKKYKIVSISVSYCYVVGFWKHESSEERDAVLQWCECSWPIQCSCSQGPGVWTNPPFFPPSLPSHLPWFGEAGSSCSHRSSAWISTASILASWTSSLVSDYPHWVPSIWVRVLTKSIVQEISLFLKVNLIAYFRFKGGGGKNWEFGTADENFIYRVNKQQGRTV